MSKLDTIILKIQNNLSKNTILINELKSFIIRWTNKNISDDPTPGEVIQMVKNFIIQIFKSYRNTKVFKNLTNDEKEEVILQLIRNIVVIELKKSKCEKEIEELVLNTYDLCVPPAISLAIALINMMNQKCCCF